jgi:hypothetical protein
MIIGHKGTALLVASNFFAICYRISAYPSVGGQLVSTLGNTGGAQWVELVGRPGDLLYQSPGVQNGK